MLLRLLQILFLCKVVWIPFDGPDTFNDTGSVTYKFVCCYFSVVCTLGTFNIYNQGLGLFLNCELYYLVL
jgi:hypothetical protein